MSFFLCEHCLVLMILVVIVVVVVVVVVMVSLVLKCWALDCRVSNVTDFVLISDLCRLNYLVGLIVR